MTKMGKEKSLSLQTFSDFRLLTGFTLIELLVVISIIIILSAIILPNYRVGESQFALQRSAHKLALDLRRAEELSMSAKTHDCSTIGAGWIMKGYGINLTVGADYYLLKARCEEIANPGHYDDETVGDKIYLETGVKISTVNSLNLFFYPPEPVVDLGGVDAVVIILSLKTDITKTKTIKVNKVGLINVE